MCGIVDYVRLCFVLLLVLVLVLAQARGKPLLWSVNVSPDHDHDSQFPASCRRPIAGFTMSASECLINV